MIYISELTLVCQLKKSYSEVLRGHKCWLSNNCHKNLKLGSTDLRFIKVSFERRHLSDYCWSKKVIEVLVYENNLWAQFYIRFIFYKTCWTHKLLEKKIKALNLNTLRSKYDFVFSKILSAVVFVISSTV